MGASIGIAFNTTLNETVEDLIRDADRAMYRAKAQGKNRYVISDQADIPENGVQRPMETDGTTQVVLMGFYGDIERGIDMIESW